MSGRATKAFWLERGGKVCTHDVVQDKNNLRSSQRNKGGIFKNSRPTMVEVFEYGPKKAFFVLFYTGPYATAKNLSFNTADH